ncbi:VOC family protein [Streptomyces cyaneofuscatus]
MAVHDVAHVELFMRDKVSALDHFVSGMGFTPVADSVEVDRSSTLLCQGDVRLVVTTGHGIRSFLNEHGDGIADIALTCDDVAATRERAVTAGATPVPSRYGVPCVTAFGDVRHTLLPRRSVGTAPPGRRWVAVSRSPAPSAGRIRRLGHVAVRLEREKVEGQADFYRDAFGLSRDMSGQAAAGETAGDSVVVRGASGRVSLALAAAPAGAAGPGPLDDFPRCGGSAGAESLVFLTDDDALSYEFVQPQGLPASDRLGSTARYEPAARGQLAAR